MRIETTNRVPASLFESPRCSARRAKNPVPFVDLLGGESTEQITLLTCR